MIAQISFGKAITYWNLTSIRNIISVVQNNMPIVTFNTHNLISAPNCHNNITRRTSSSRTIFSEKQKRVQELPEVF